MPDQSRVLLCGEANPYSRDPEDALYHLPRGVTGDRLREILGMTDAEYLRAFVRRNLYAGPQEGGWSVVNAGLRAGELVREHRPRVVLALGRRVTAAFCRVLVLSTLDAFEAYTTTDSVNRDLAYVTLASLPHPSGLCRTWNEPDARQRARDLVGKVRGLVA